MICSAGMGEQTRVAREERGTAASSADGCSYLCRPGFGRAGETRPLNSDRRSELGPFQGNLMSLSWALLRAAGWGGVPGVGGWVGGVPACFLKAYLGGQCG